MIWELAPSRKPGARAALCLRSGRLRRRVPDTPGVSQHRRAVLRRFAAGGVDPNDLAMTLALALPMAWYLGMTYRKPLLRWICRAYLPVAAGRHRADRLPRRHAGEHRRAHHRPADHDPALARPAGHGDRHAVPLRRAGGRLRPGQDRGAARHHLDGSARRLVSAGGSSSGRPACSALPQQPLLGYGTVRLHPAISPQLGSASQVAHNSYISVLVEQGLIGLRLYLLMFLAAYRGVRRLPLLERRFALVLLATLRGDDAAADLGGPARRSGSSWRHLVGFSQALRAGPPTVWPAASGPGRPAAGRPSPRRPVGSGRRCATGTRGA